jgi:hypothetical protein
MSILTYTMKKDGLLMWNLTLIVQEQGTETPKLWGFWPDFNSRV